MTAPQVSIVIPTFNRAQLLPRAIDSSLAQTLPCEVVVCDHGSSDATPAVAAAYGDRIRYIRRAEDRGPIVSWRDGIEQARGECVHLNYDDDWIEPEFVERTLALLRPDVGFVYTRTRIHEPGKPATRVLLRHPAGIGPRARIVQFLLREKLPISPGCALFRRSDMLKNLLEEIPGAGGTYGRNSGVGEDLLLFLLATLDYPCYAHVPEPLAHFLAHPTSITTDAGSSGKMAALAEAYRVAKDHYLRQPGSIAARRGLAARLAKLGWQLSCRLRG